MQLEWLFSISDSNALENACAGPDEGRIFIDRDPRWFHLILNYLRDGRCVMPTDEAALREILYEADFYQVSPAGIASLGEASYRDACEALGVAPSDNQP